MGEVIDINFDDEMKDSFRDYAVSVIVGRALADVKDGFKPVHRRVLYAMRDLGILPNTPYKKSARIVGEVIGKYHPHGDTAVYDTMVKLAQDFGMSLPLVDGHGNFGSIDGDSAAAMRYTEARLSPISMYMLQDLEKNVVDFRDNYDGTEREPNLLPARIPNLLVNGTFGIAVGMRSYIPPHNLGEIIDSFLHYTKKPNSTIDELISFIPGPDYPTGGIITNAEEIKELYRTGRAKAIIRSKIDIEPAQYGKTNIVITEIPFSISGSKTKFVNDLTMMVVEKKLNEVVDVRDESSKDGIRIVLEVKKGVNLDKFLTKLYAKTKIEDSENYQFLAIVDGKPITLNLKEYFKEYLDFQKEIMLRKYQYLYEKGLLRKEILDGLMEAIEVIDAIVEAIRGAKNVNQMKKCLMKGEIEGITFRLKKNEKIAQGFHFTERQAKAILDMKLQKLGGLEVEALKKEHDKLLKDLEFYQKVLNDEKVLLKEIRKEHEQIKKEYDSPRKTAIQEIAQTKYVEETKIEDVIILVDRFGYTKTMDGAKSDSDLEEMKGSHKYVLATKSNDRLVAFTNLGNLYQLKLNDIPKGKLKDKGATIQALAGLERGEYPVFVSTKAKLEEETYLFITKSGLAKQTKGADLISSRMKVAAAKLNYADELIFVGNVQEEQRLVLQTKRGYVAQLNPTVFAVMNKTAKGVNSLTLKENDELENIYLLPKGVDKELSINGKNISTAEISESKRGSVGKLIK